MHTIHVLLRHLWLPFEKPAPFPVYLFRFNKLQTDSYWLILDFILCQNQGFIFTYTELFKRLTELVQLLRTTVWNWVSLSLLLLKWGPIIWASSQELHLGVEQSISDNVYQRTFHNKHPWFWNVGAYSAFRLRFSVTSKAYNLSIRFIAYMGKYKLEIM